MKTGDPTTAFLVVLLVTLVSSNWLLPPSPNLESAPGRGVSSGQMVRAATDATGKIGSGLLFLTAVREKPGIWNIKGIKEVLDDSDRKGGADVSIWFDRILSDSEAIAFENRWGVRFHRVDGLLKKWSPILPAVVPWGAIVAIARLPEVKSVDTSVWPPPAPAMDHGVPETGAHLVWPLSDGQGRNITGKGVKVAIYDTGIDIFHPDFFQPDPAELPYNWIDANQNGVFDPGLDYVDLNRNGQADPNEKLRFIEIDGGTPGVFDTDIDWLYNDAYDNGQRDFGAQAGFSESSPSYGERLFVVNDIGNKRLDVGEQLIALSVSKIWKTYSYELVGTPPNQYYAFVTRTRGDATNPPIGTPRDQHYHGTFNAGIISAGKPG
ncbi:MAG: S8 family serine peptidase [Chloroflexi bacterium]|nr:S8 family serine peptidase [Chloroflexota bacterium]